MTKDDIAYRKQRLFEEIEELKRLNDRIAEGLVIKKRAELDELRIDCGNLVGHQMDVHEEIGLDDVYVCRWCGRVGYGSRFKDDE